MAIPRNLRDQFKEFLEHKGGGVDINIDSANFSQLSSDGPRIVSPSIDAGYDSLQSAVDDAEVGGSTEIWLAEDIEENVLIPHEGDADWGNRGGLTIRGITGSQTEIKDAAADGTPILKVDPADSIRKLTLENLHLVDSGVDTRAFSYAPREAGSSGSMAVSSMRNCRFEAPTVLGRMFHCYFEDIQFVSNVETDYTPNAGQSLGTITTAAACILRGGNQYTFNRCNFKNDTGTLKYGSLWAMGGNAGYFPMCFFTVGNEGYDTGVSRNVAPLLIDGGGQLVFDAPYCEQAADYAAVCDNVVTSGAVDSLRLNDTRLHSLRLDVRVKGLVVDSPALSIEIDTGGGIPEPGCYVHETVQGMVTVSGGNGRFLEVKKRRPEGWNVTTPTPPGATGTNIRNDESTPVIVYDSGGSGRHIVDFHGNDTTIPNDNMPIRLGLQEEIYYDTTAPSSWAWYGIQ